MDNSKLNMDASILECEHELLALLTDIHETFTKPSQIHPSNLAGPAELAELYQNAYNVCIQCLQDICDSSLHTMLKHMHNTYAGKTNIQYLDAKAKSMHELMDMLEAFRSAFSILFLAYLDNEYDFASIQSKLANKHADTDTDADTDANTDADTDANATQEHNVYNHCIRTKLPVIASKLPYAFAEASILKLANICIQALPP